MGQAEEDGIDAEGPRTQEDEVRDGGRLSYVDLSLQPILRDLNAGLGISKINNALREITQPISALQRTSEWMRETERMAEYWRARERADQQLRALERLREQWRAIEQANEQWRLIERANEQWRSIERATWPFRDLSNEVAALTRINASFLTATRLARLSESFRTNAIHQAHAAIHEQQNAAFESLSLFERYRTAELRARLHSDALRVLSNDRSDRLSLMGQGGNLLTNVSNEARLQIANLTESALSEISIETHTQDELAELEKSRAKFLHENLSQIMRDIVRNPELRYKLHWRQFEILCAEILDRMGWTVTLGTGSHDQGIDIVAEKRDGYRFVMGVQCKRHSKLNTVEPLYVNALHGVVISKHFNKGLLITTTTFQPAAVSYASTLNDVISLDNGDEFVRKLRQVSGYVEP